MSDTPEYLPKTRDLFRKFINAHQDDYFMDMQESKTGPGTGYGTYYRSGDVTQHMRDIHHNLFEKFGYVIIPAQFPSAKNLVENWRAFHDFLVEREAMFQEIFEHIKAKDEPAREPLIFVYRNHMDTLALMDGILSSPECMAIEQPEKLHNQKKRTEELENENLQLRFDNYWRNQCWKYVLYLSSFFLFIAIVIYLLSERDRTPGGKSAPFWIIVVLFLVTILFNLLFNNHSSFKDSWKLLLPSSRKKLKELQRRRFFANDIP